MVSRSGNVTGYIVQKVLALVSCTAEKKITLTAVND
jgi:hypothetical protein